MLSHKHGFIFASGTVVPGTGMKIPAEAVVSDGLKTALALKRRILLRG